TLHMADIGPPRLQWGGGPFEFQVGVGTPGVGPGTLGELAYYYAGPDGVVKDVVPPDPYPLAEVDFPAQPPSGRPPRVRGPHGQQAESVVRAGFASDTDTLTDEPPQCDNALTHLDSHDTIDHRPERDATTLVGYEKPVTRASPRGAPARKSWRSPLNYINRTA